MPTEEAFLGAIVAEPDDDAPRLIYADWLDEQGDCERAEFIRVQCALARMDDDDERGLLLEEREQELLNRHEKDWLGLIEPWLSSWQFRRGFLECIRVSAQLFTEHAKVFARVNSIQELHFDENSGSQGVAARLGLPPRLRKLDLALGDVTAQDLDALTASGRLTELTDLELSFNPLGPAGAAILAATKRLPKLRRLSLSSCNLGASGMESLSRSTGLTRLESLDLNSNEIGGAGAEWLAQARHFLSLRALRLGDNRVSESGLRTLARSQVLPRLTELDLGGNLFNGLPLDRLADALAGSPLMQRLTFLGLAGNHLGASGLRGLLRSAAPLNLTGLNLARTGVAEAGVRALTQSAVFPQLANLCLAGEAVGGIEGLTYLCQAARLSILTNLSLRNNFLGPFAIKEVALAPWKRLHILDLGENDAGDVGMQAVAALKGLAQVQQLCLEANSIGDDGAATLARAGYLDRLIRLDLRRNEIGPVGALALAASPLLPRLRELDLSMNNLNGASVVSLLTSQGVSHVYLDVRGNPIDDQEREELKARFGSRLTI